MCAEEEARERARIDEGRDRVAVTLDRRVCERSGRTAILCCCGGLGRRGGVDVPVGRCCRSKCRSSGVGIAKIEVLELARSRGWSSRDPNPGPYPDSRLHVIDTTRC